MARCAAFATLLVAAMAALVSGQASRSHLVIVVDGLRPDYVTPDVMPRLSRLGQRGTVFNAHHAVFPTVTRVNAATFVTGTYPEAHGILGNTIYLPGVDASKGLDTGDRETLERITRIEDRLLTAPSLGEMLRPVGKRLLVTSSGSSGSALLLNHREGSGSTIHTGFVRPAPLAEKARAMLGEVPAKGMPNDAQNQYAIDAYLKVGLDEVRPDVTFMWLNDPDGTAHAKGIGAPMSRQSLSLVDAGIGRIEDTLERRGLLQHTNIIVTSDHGFSTHTGDLRLSQIVEPFARKMADGSSDLVVAEGAIYQRSKEDPARTAAIVAALQQQPSVGAIFTRAAAGARSKGAIPGTLSFDIARWNHPRSGAILVSANWTDEMNSAGYKGTTTQAGVAGHGTSSPYDVHNTLIAAGPDFREHAVSDLPTGNVDIAPTLLHLLGMPVPSSMAGRVIAEGLRGGNAKPVHVERRLVHAKTVDGRYEVIATLSSIGNREYLDHTHVIRR